jgi:hypothetical protein
LVHTRSDAQLDAVFGTRAGQALVFGGMQRAFVPEAAIGVRGTIQYLVGPRPWLLSIADCRLTIAQTLDPSPTVTLRMPPSTFARIAAGQTTAPAAALAGRLQIEGDLKLAARLAIMLGRAPL